MSSRRLTPERLEEEARQYAWLIREPNLNPTWRLINEDLIERYSRTGLLRIKTRAWQIVQRREATE